MLLLLSLLSLLISFHGSSVHTAALTADRCVGNYYYERLFVFIWLFCHTVVVLGISSWLPPSRPVVHGGHGAFYVVEF